MWGVGTKHEKETGSRVGDSGCLYGDVFHLLDKHNIVSFPMVVIFDREHQRCNQVE